LSNARPPALLTVYLLSAVGGSVCCSTSSPAERGALGASGAIFGLFGAWFVVSRRLHLDSRWIVTDRGAEPGARLRGTEHRLAGARGRDDLAGGLLTAAFAYAPQHRPQARTLIQVAATAAIIVLLAAAVLARNHQLAAAALG
jgi:membrane associated rhomboid family serine protease